MKRKIFFIALASCFIGVLLTGIGYLQNGFDHVKTRSNQVTKTIDSFTNLSINTNYYDIIIKETDDDKASVSYLYDKALPIDYSVDNNTLTLRDNPKKSHFSNIHINLFLLSDLKSFLDTGTAISPNTIVLSIPKSITLETLAIKSNSSDISLNDINIKDLNLTSRAGDLLIQNTTIDSSKIILNGGDSDILNSQLNQTTLKLPAGDMTIEDTMLNDTNITLSQGDFIGTNLTYQNTNSLTQVSGDTSIGLADYNLNISYNASVSLTEKLTTSATNNLSIENKFGDVNID